jgi:hypothetical protein
MKRSVVVQVVRVIIVGMQFRRPYSTVISLHAGTELSKKKKRWIVVLLLRMHDHYLSAYDSLTEVPQTTGRQEACPCFNKYKRRRGREEEWATTADSETTHLQLTILMHA